MDHGAVPMIPHENPYIAWMRDRAGELTPTEEVVVASLPALGEALRTDLGPARAALREAHATLAAAVRATQPEPAAGGASEGEPAGEPVERAEPAANAEPGAPAECVEPAANAGPAEPAAAPSVPDDGLGDDETLHRVAELLLQGACRELDRLAGSPANASFLEAALRYAVEPDAVRALELPHEPAVSRAGAVAEFDAWLAARTGVGGPDAGGPGQVVAARGSAIVREVFYAEPRHHRGEPPPPMASFGARAGGYVFDYFLLVLLSNLVVLAAISFFAITDEPVSQAIGWLATGAGLLAGAVLLTRWGATPGRMAFGLEVRRRVSGERLAFSRAFLRQFLGEPVNLLFCGAGFWFGWLRRSHHTWADDISDADVVVLPRSLAFRRRLQAALGLAVFVSVCLQAWLAGFEARGGRLEGELSDLFTQSAALQDSIEWMATRSVTSQAAYTGDLWGVLTASKSYDSLLVLEASHVRHYRKGWFLPAGTLRFFAKLDSLIVLRQERSQLRQRIARAQLTVPFETPPAETPPVRRIRYLMSDVEALDQRMAPLSQYISAGVQR
jgi:uncharacterized RDD family membrane protein YckC